MEGWQQFVVHARDEPRDGVSDYIIEVLTEKDNKWSPFEEMYVDVEVTIQDRFKLDGLEFPFPCRLSQ